MYLIIPKNERHNTMNNLHLLLQNKILISSILGWMVAQILKTLIHLYFNKNFDPERLVGSGGMPSSHSSTVCALATSSGLIYGLNSFEFAVTTMFAIIVMYDAMGVRRETGIQAKILNEMIAIFNGMNKQVTVEDKLKELVGHTPLQVLAGAILGIFIAFLVLILI